MLIEKTECGVYGNSKLFLHLFCKSKTVLKYKIYLKNEGIINTHTEE